MKHSIVISDIEHVGEAARQFVKLMGDSCIFAFYGSMGAGKTTFIKALCEELGVSDVITSPTFAIVNEYTITQPPARPEDACYRRDARTPNTHQTIYHFDFYRIKRIEEVYDMGYEDYFYSGNLCFIEWPELIEQLLPDDAVHVSIIQQPDNSRILSFER